MLKFKFAVAAVGATLALGSASVMAMVVADPDAHGDLVSSAARFICPHGPHGAHGHCVSSFARSNGAAESAENSGKSPVAGSKSHKGGHHGRALGRLS